MEDEWMLNTGDSIDYFFYEKGKDLYDQKKYQEAMYYFELTAKINASSKTCELLGNCYAHCGREAEAITYLSAAACLNNQPSVRIALSELLLNSKHKREYKLVIRLLNEVLKLQPTNKRAKEMLIIAQELEEKLING